MQPIRGAFRLQGFDRAAKRVPFDHMAVLAERIESNPGKCGGRPCIRDLRIRVSDVLEMLASGMSRDEILSEHPSLEDKDITAALRFASERIDHAILVA